MLPAIVSQTLYYTLGVIPPSMAALHAASTKSEGDLHYWLRYLLLFATLESVVFPCADPVLSLLPTNLWSTAKMVFVVSLIVPSTGLLGRCYDFVEKNAEQYGLLVSSVVRSRMLAPIRSQLEKLVASFQNQPRGASSQ